MIPAPVVKLHESDSLFHETAGQKAVVGEGGVVALIQPARVGSRFRLRDMSEPGSVELEDVLGFLAEVHYPGHGHLHSESQLILGNPGNCLRVTNMLVLVCV